MNNRRRELTPQELIEAVKRQLTRPLETGDRIVLVEASADQLQYVILCYSSFYEYDFHIFAEPRSLEPERWAATVAQRRGNDLLNYLRETLHRELHVMGLDDIKQGFALGDLGAEWPNEVNHTLKQAFRGVEFATLRAHPDAPDVLLLPDSTSLIESLNGQTCRPKHELRVLLYSLDDTQTPPELLVVTRRVYGSNGRAVRKGDYLATLELCAPFLNQDMLVVFEEIIPSRSQPRRLGYFVVPTAYKVTARVFFDGLDWDVKWDKANPSESRPRREALPEAPYPPLVEVKKSPSNLVLVVESTLGMRRWYNELQGIDPSTYSGLTSFQEIKKLCEGIVTHMSDFPNLRFLLVLYGNHQPIPFEFRGLPVRSANPVVTHLPWPDDFHCVVGDELLDEIKASFDNKQTVTDNWNKAVEEALQYLNDRVEWDHSDRVAIWIAQGPPNVCVSEGQDYPPIDQPGFPTSISFKDELQRSRDNDIRHVALFVSNDLTEREDLRDQARQVWRSVSNPGGLMIEIDGSFVSQADINRIVRKLEGFCRLNSNVIVAEPVPGQQCALPFEYDSSGQGIRYVYYNEESV